jgi:hypothetical protein
MIEIRFDKTKDEVALLIWFLVDHSVVVLLVISHQLISHHSSVDNNLYK